MKRQTCALLILTCAGIGLAPISSSPVVVLAAEQTASGDVTVPTGDVNLGTIALPRRVMADGQTLPAGTYELHVTSAMADPEAPGQLAVLERWVEFRQGGQVRGREVVSIVPQSEIGDVAKSAPPASGSSRVELLKENEYLRVWVNQQNTHYFIHLVVG